MLSRKFSASMVRAVSLIYILSIMATGCSKKDSVLPPPPPPISDSNRITIFTNSSDPRLAQFDMTNGVRYIFYGSRDASGQPLRLTGYSMSTLPDSTNVDLLTFDDSGRYSNIILKSGEQFHVNYSIPDSIQIIVYSPDSLPKFYVTALTTNKIIKSLNPTTFGLNGQSSTLGSDKNVNISITKRNTVTNIESPVNLNDRSYIDVEVNIIDGSRFNYTLLAEYDNLKNLYSVPLTSFGFVFNDPGAIEKTLETIKEGIDIACLISAKGVSSKEKAFILENIEIAACIYGGPIGCSAVPTFLITCAGIEFLENFFKLEKGLSVPLDAVAKKIDPNFLPIGTNSNVIVKTSYKGQIKNPDKILTVSQILENNTSFDYKITYDFTSQPSDTFRYKAGFQQNGVGTVYPMDLNLHFENGTITGYAYGNRMNGGTVTGNTDGSTMTLTIDYDNQVVPALTGCNGFNSDGCPNCTGGVYNEVQKWTITGTTDINHSTLNGTFDDEVKNTQKVLYPSGTGTCDVKDVTSPGSAVGSFRY